MYGEAAYFQRSTTRAKYIMSTVLIPNFKTFNEWLMSLNQSLPRLTIPLPVHNSNKWHPTAMLLISINGKILTNTVLPLKENFPSMEDWRKWAFHFIQSTQTL